MYFPYLKLRQQEALAIKDTICSYSDSKVVPILEPYNKNELELYNYKNMISTISLLIAANKKFILIINNESDIRLLKSRFFNFDNYCVRGYYSDNPIVKYYQGNNDIAIIHKNTSIILQDVNKIKYHIMMPEVLTFASYLRNYPTNKIVRIEDAFEKHSPNNTYPASDIFNSESVFTFKQDGYAGFGDFTILEEHYDVPTGADADKVSHVIHLTRKQDLIQKLEVCHYLTTPEMEPDNRRRSIFTIEKAYNDRHRFLNTKGIQMLAKKYHQASNPAYYKRIGIIHHIELMRSLI